MNGMKGTRDWKKILSEDEYKILRLKDTEPPFSGKYNDFYEKGIYLCRACGSNLFSSEDKIKSGTGWPSFSRPIIEENICLEKDFSFGMVRTEALCSLCESHLGHFFPEEQRYCINSLALEFIPEAETREVEEIVLNHGQEEIPLIGFILEQEGIEYRVINEDLQDLFGAGRIGTGVNSLVGEIKIAVRRKDYRVAQYLIDTV